MKSPILDGRDNLWEQTIIQKGMADCWFISILLHSFGQPGTSGKGEQKGHDLVLPPDSIQLTLRLNVHSKNYSPQELCGENTESLVSFALFTEGG